MGSFQWEIDFMTALQGASGKVLTSLMEGVSILGEETVMVLVIGLIYWCLNKELGRKMALGMVLSLLSGEMIKCAVMRRRPYFDHSEVSCLRAPSGKGDVMDVVVQGYSFPSLHASNSVVMFGTLARSARRRWQVVLCLVLIALIGFSRSFLGVHYPTDVLVGWVLGFCALWVAFKAVAQVKDWLKIALVVALLTLPGWWFCHTEVFSSVYGLMLGMFGGFAFEERVVKFSNTKNVWRCLLRLVCGMTLFFGVSVVLKSVLPADQVCRCVRYLVASFIAMGVYPMAFKYTDKLWKQER